MTAQVAMPDYRTPTAGSRSSSPRTPPSCWLLEARAIAAYVAENTGVTARDVAAHLFRTGPRGAIAQSCCARRRRRRPPGPHRRSAGAGGRDVTPNSGRRSRSGPELPRRLRVFPARAASARHGRNALPALARVPRQCRRHLSRGVDAPRSAGPRATTSSARSPTTIRSATTSATSSGLFMHMVALAAMWDDAGASPAMTVGHSQNEIAAAYRSGVMTLDDSLTIVTGRAEMVRRIPARLHDGRPRRRRRHVRTDSRPAFGMGPLWVVNSPHILCISGERGAVLDIIETLTADGIFAKGIRRVPRPHQHRVGSSSPLSAFRSAHCWVKFLFDGGGALLQRHRSAGPWTPRCRCSTTGSGICATRSIRPRGSKGRRRRGCTSSRSPTLALAMAENLPTTRPRCCRRRAARRRTWPVHGEPRRAGGRRQRFPVGTTRSRRRWAVAASTLEGFLTRRGAARQPNGPTGPR